MHLVDLLTLRTEPARGLYLSLTRRCPLSCAHCISNSTMQSEEYSGEIFLRFVRSFTPANRPDFLVLTGGEPLLQPQLVVDIAEQAHVVGTRICLGSGMFFARYPKVSKPIQRAIDAVDIMTVSIDAFHEREVPRSAVFHVVHSLLDQGKAIHFQIVGLDEDDPYLVDVTNDIRGHFGERVPSLICKIGPKGRATRWLKPALETPSEEIEAFGCGSAAWPVVSYDGTIVACCNQDVVDGPRPPHLQLGDAATDDWEVVRQRLLTSAMQRALRLYGPEYITDRYGSSKLTCDGYCSTCYRLSDDPDLIVELENVMARPTTRWLEMRSQEMHKEALHYNLPGFEAWITMGYQPS